MPRIMLPNKSLLSQSKTGFGSRRGSSSLGYRPASSALNGSAQARSATARRQSMNQSQLDMSSSRRQNKVHVVDNDESSSSSDGSISPPAVDDWGFFVDIAPSEEEETTTERTFLNGFNSRTGAKLRTINDSGY